MFLRKSCSTGMNNKGTTCHWSLCRSHSGTAVIYARPFVSTTSPTRRPGGFTSLLHCLRGSRPALICGLGLNLALFISSRPPLSLFGHSIACLSQPKKHAKQFKSLLCGRQRPLWPSSALSVTHSLPVPRSMHGCARDPRSLGPIPFLEPTLNLTQTPSPRTSVVTTTSCSLVAAL